MLNRHRADSQAAMTEAPSSERPVTRWLLGAILIAAAVYWSLDYQPYVLPNSDFFRIKDLAADIAAWRVPADFKQMPLVPLLMLPLAALLPVSNDEYLHALSILNIVLSLGSLVLTYYLARLFLGGTIALVPVALLLAAPQFTVSAHQPMLEPTIGFFALATLVALVYRPIWAYPLAGLAALTRYELALLFVVVFVVEMMRQPSAWRAIVARCAVAGLPFAAWFGLSILVPAEGNPYFDDIVRASPVHVATNLLTPFPSRSFMLLFLAVGWTIGLITAWQRHRRAAVAIALFFALYLVAHFVYGRPLTRYSYTVLWVVPLLATVGLGVVFRWVGRALTRRSRWLVGMLVLGASAAALELWYRAAANVSQRLGDAAIANDLWYVAWSTLWVIVVVVAVWTEVVPSGAWRAATAAAAVAALVVVPVVQASSALSRAMTGVYYDKAELVLALGWLAEHLPPDATAVLPRYHELRDGMPTIDPERRVAYSDFEAETHDEFVEELELEGVDYVVYMLRPGRPTDPSHPLYARDLANYLSAKVYLMEPFVAGEEVVGFEKLATIPAPHPAYGHPTHVYRRIATPTGLGGTTDD